MRSSKGVRSDGRKIYRVKTSATRHSLIGPALVTSLGTLCSRILGMVRDMATAALFGLSGGGVMDAFVVAYRVPNLFRSLFGEGALTASYLPVFTAAHHRDPREAWGLTSVLLSWLAVLLTLVVVLGEGIYLAIYLLAGDAPGMGLVASLGATLLPYLVLVCIAAQLSATLTALGHFGLPALVPTVLNVCWLFAVWFVAPRFAPDREAQALVIAVAVLVAGGLQIAVQVPLLYRRGFRFRYDPAAAADSMRRIVRTMLPMIAGLTVTQINTFADSLIAWSFAAAPGGPAHIPWLAGQVAYPLQQGAAAAIYCGERLYQFPLGILGAAVATAIFPLLSRHAAAGDRARVSGDLTRGLRLVTLLSVPATAGLILLAMPLARLLFDYGEVTADDTARAARMIAVYGMGVWAYCASPVLVRGFHALGDAATPAKVAGGMVALNLTLNLTLIWPLAESGIAAATVVSAAVQLAILAALFTRRQSRLDFAALGRTALVAVLATALMALAAGFVLSLVSDAPSIRARCLRVFLPMLAGATVYGASVWACGETRRGIGD